MLKKKTPKKTQATQAATTKPKGRPSLVAAFAHLLGTVPDTEIVKLSGATRKAVEQYRLKRHIKAFDPRRTTDAVPPEKGDAVVVASPAAIASAAAKAPPAKKTPAAKKAAAPKKAKKTPGAKKGATPKKTPAAKKAPATSVKKAVPKKRGPSNNKGKKRGWAARLLAENRHIVGVKSDQEIATQLGMSSEAVRQWRRKEGITSASLGGPATQKKAAGTKAAPVTAKAAATKAAASKKTPPAPAKPAATPPRVEAFVPQGATSICWRVSVRDGEAVHIIADGLAAAAARVEKALGAAAVAIERVGAGIA